MASSLAAMLHMELEFPKSANIKERVLGDIAVKAFMVPALTVPVEIRLLPKIGVGQEPFNADADADADADPKVKLDGERFEEPSINA